MTAPLELTRAQVLAHRRRVSALDARLPPGEASRCAAARAGLTDSVPRAALLSLHARVAGATPSDVHRPPFVQVWGPRFSVYVVGEDDRAPFTLGRTITDPARRAHAERVAERLAEVLDGREMGLKEAADAIGEHHHQLRYAATTGRVLLTWDGARAPRVRSAPRPDGDPDAARVELARRHLHVLGPSTLEGFGSWAGLRPPAARAALAALAAELVPVRTPAGDAWVLTDDEASFRARPGPTAPARLLPSGDTFFLLWGRDRELLVPDATLRAELWTPRVWPGAVLVDGDVVGTWRRAEARVTVQPWRPLPRAAREAVEREAADLPLPGLTTGVSVAWSD